MWGCVVWSDPSVIISAVCAFVAWLGSIGALLWKMGSGTQMVVGELSSLSLRIEGVEKEIAIGRESRQNLHGRIDNLTVDVTEREKSRVMIEAGSHREISQRLTALETRLEFERRKSSPGGLR